jgi:hypothetical protein
MTSFTGFTVSRIPRAINFETGPERGAGDGDSAEDEDEEEDQGREEDRFAPGHVGVDCRYNQRVKDETIVVQPPRSNRGCLRAALAAPVLVVLAPFAVAVRWFSKVRRGPETEVAQQVDAVSLDDGRTLLKARVEIDVPHESNLDRALTGEVVRLAESLSSGGENYHLLRDEPGADEPVVVSIGPSVQLLAERFMVTLQRSALEQRTIVWLALPRTLALGKLLDPTSYSPEDEGEPQKLIMRCPLVWAMALRWRRNLASVRYALEVWTPEGSGTALRTFCDRLRKLSVR